MNKKVTFAEDVKKDDGNTKPLSKKSKPKNKSNHNKKTIQNLLEKGWTGGCLVHPGCLWSTPCDCANCVNFI